MNSPEKHSQQTKQGCERIQSPWWSASPNTQELSWNSVKMSGNLPDILVSSFHLWNGSYTRLQCPSSRKAWASIRSWGGHGRTTKRELWAAHTQGYTKLPRCPGSTRPPSAQWFFREILWSQEPQLRVITTKMTQNKTTESPVDKGQRKILQVLLSAPSRGPWGMECEQGWTKGSSLSSSPEFSPGSGHAGILCMTHIKTLDYKK